MCFQALKQLPRDKVQLATKFGISVLPESTKAMGLVDQIRITGTPEYVRKCCEASLKRLDLDYIDLYYQHRVDVSVPIEETVSILELFVYCSHNFELLNLKDNLEFFAEVDGGAQKACGGGESKVHRTI